MNGNAVVKKYRAIVVVQCVDCNDFNTLFFPHDIGQHLIFHFFFRISLIGICALPHFQKKEVSIFICLFHHSLANLDCNSLTEKKIEFFSKPHRNEHTSNQQIESPKQIENFGVWDN